MLWLPVIALIVIAVISANRKVFAISFVILFVAVAGQRILGTMDVFTGVDFQDTEVIRNTEPCGSAVGVLFGDDTDSLRPNMARECEKLGRTRLAEAFGALLVGLGGAAGGWVLIPRLRPTPIDEVLNPLPESEEYVTGRPRGERRKRR